MAVDRGGTTQYIYPAGQNNGRISQSISGGQTVNYTYDSLNRLATAKATDGSWGNAYSYDGFGNLMAKTVTAGSAPNFSGSYDLATNHGGGAYGSAYYDANGNPLYGPLDPATGNWVNYTYDVENRMIGSCELNTCYTGSPHSQAPRWSSGGPAEERQRMTACRGKETLAADRNWLDIT